jgi:hypothetical protein
MEGCVEDRLRSPGSDILEWRGEVDDMDEVNGSHDTYIRTDMNRLYPDIDPRLHCLADTGWMQIRSHG